MKKSYKQIAAAASLATLLCASTAAHAQNGVIGGIIDKIAPGVGTQLDQANDKLGNPFDHAVAAGAESVVPGSGSALEAAWQLQRAGSFNSGGVASSVPAAQMAPVPALGNMCITPVGNFGGPLNPLGMPCQAMTPHGVVSGFVSR